MFRVAPPVVVPKDQIFVADALGSVVSVGTQVGGCAAGGALVYLVGPFGGASLYSALLVAATAFSVPLSLVVPASPRTPFWETFRTGWRSFRGAAGRALSELAALEVWMGFFAAVPPRLITAVAYQRFSSPSDVYGPLVTAFAIGGSAAGVWIGHVNPRRHIGTLLVLAPLAAGACVLALSGPATPVVAVALLFAGAGAGLATVGGLPYTWMQGTYPPELLGRLSRNLYLFTGTSATVAVVLVGVLSVGVALGTLIRVDGVGLLVGGAVAFALPRVRRMAF